MIQEVSSNNHKKQKSNNSKSSHKDELLFIKKMQDNLGLYSKNGKIENFFEGNTSLEFLFQWKGIMQALTTKGVAYIFDPVNKKMSNITHQ